MIKSKKKIIFLTTSLILTICLMGFMGVYALTIKKNSMFNVGITYQPEYLVKVEMGIDGANGGRDNQTIEENEYVEIFNSLNPVSNGMYIQSISSDTIRLEANSLTPDSEGLVYFRFYILDGETKDIIASVNCGETTETTSTLTTTATQLSIQTGVTANNPALLGALKINIKFEEKIPELPGILQLQDGKLAKNNSENYIKFMEFGYSASVGELPDGISQSLSSSINDLLYQDISITPKRLTWPIQWTVIAATIEENFGDGNTCFDNKTVLCTDVNLEKGLFKIENGRVFIENKPAKKLLLICTKSLYNMGYEHTKGEDFFSTSLNEFMNGSYLSNQQYSEMMNKLQLQDIMPYIDTTNINQTTYKQGHTSNNNLVKFFLLGWNGKLPNSEIVIQNDSFGLGTYFGDGYDESGDVYKLSKHIASPSQLLPKIFYPAYTLRTCSLYFKQTVLDEKVDEEGTDSLYSVGIRPACVVNVL